MHTTNPVAPKAPLAPPDRTLIADTVKTKLPAMGRVEVVSPLAGDASNRRYFRLSLTGGATSSLILMQLAEPEGFKQSEEAASGPSIQIAELPFTNILSHLAACRLAVPTLYYYDRDAGLLYLEDFGDVTLAEACRTAAIDGVAALYRQAIESLVVMQMRATEPANPHCVAFHRKFDVALLMWEFDHFLEYGVAARRSEPMTAGDARLVRNEFRNIAELLASQPSVFVHRDYHSRNLMVDGSRLGILDFQDALMGPAAYDLASLLRDAYLALEEPLIDELIRFFLDGLSVHGIRHDPIAFRRVFDLTSIQRNLKAAGRFVYIDRVKHNPKFLADIPRVLGYVRRNLETYPELAVLRTHLTPYVPELQ